MEPITAILGLAGTLINKIWGNKDDELKRQFLMEFQDKLNEVDLLKGQLGINQAEAANPNRKWITWRELVGYFCALAVGWSYLLQPFINYFVVLSGHPAPLLPALDMSQMMFLLSSMLGIAGIKSWEKSKNIPK